MTANMKTSELRIGNLLNYGGITSEVTRVDKLFFYVEASETPTFSKDEERGATPIPLTEEWLSKFELEHVEVRGRWIKDKFVIWKQRYLDPLSIFEQNKFYLQMVDIQGDIFTLHLEIQYVHQLQNLYFALTGEELTIKSE